MSFAKHELVDNHKIIFHTGRHWRRARVVQGSGLQNRTIAGSNPAVSSSFSNFVFIGGLSSMMQLQVGWQFVVILIFLSLGPLVYGNESSVVCGSGEVKSIKSFVDSNSVHKQALEQALADLNKKLQIIKDSKYIEPSAPVITCAGSNQACDLVFVCVSVKYN